MCRNSGTLQSRHLIPIFFVAHMRERAAVTAGRERSCRTVRNSPADRHLISQRRGRGIERDKKPRETDEDTKRNGHTEI